LGSAAGPIAQDGTDKAAHADVKCFVHETSMNSCASPLRKSYFGFVATIESTNVRTMIRAKIPKAICAHFTCRAWWSILGLLSLLLPLVVFVAI
jgi:hypothetical protein